MKTYKNKLVDSFQNEQNEFKVLLDNIDEVFFTVDFISKKLTQISPACEKIYGYKQVEFLANHDLWYDCIHPDDKVLISSQMTDLKAGKKVFNQYRILHKDRSFRWLQNKIIPTLDKEGTLIRLDGVSTEITAQILADKNLKESHERYALVTKATSDAIWDWNLETNKLYWSDGYKKMFGYANSAEEQNVTIWSKRIHELDKNRVVEGLLKVIREGNTDFWEDEYRYYKADGSILYIYDRAYIVYNEINKATRMVGAMQNITSRKKAELRSQKSKDNLRTILENTDTAYILLNINAEVLSFNGTAKTLLEETLGGKLENGIHFALALPEKRRRKIKNAITNVIQNVRKLSYEVKYKFPSRPTVWISASIFPVLDPDKKIIGVSIAATDISEKKNADEQLLKSQANLQTIFNNTNIAYVLLDKKFNIVSFNQAASAGYEKELNFILTEGENLFKSQPCDRKCIAKKRHERVLRGEVVNYEINFGEKEHLTWYNVNMFPIFDSSTNVIGLIVASEDITARKHAELEKEKMTSDLIQRNKDLEQFAYIVSHNLRAPVANILGLTNLITAGHKMNKNEHLKINEGLSLSTRKLDSVISDLSMILQVRREISEAKEYLKFSEIIEDIKVSINSLIQRERVAILTDFNDCDEFFGIRTYLYSIFYNLLSNSIKYRREGIAPVITIGAKKDQNVLLITFRDNGLGIDLTHNQGKVFGLYKKFHEHVEGKGIGLYMVKTQVETLGGKISLKSEVNKGTEFLIEFKL